MADPQGAAGAPQQERERLARIAEQRAGIALARWHDSPEGNKDRGSHRREADDFMAIAALLRSASLPSGGRSEERLDGLMAQLALAANSRHPDAESHPTICALFAAAHDALAELSGRTSLPQGRSEERQKLLAEYDEVRSRTAMIGTVEEPFSLLDVLLAKADALASYVREQP